MLEYSHSLVWLLRGQPHATLSYDSLPHGNALDVLILLFVSYFHAATLVLFSNHKWILLYEPFIQFVQSFMHIFIDSRLYCSVTILLMSLKIISSLAGFLSFLHYQIDYK